MGPCVRSKGPSVPLTGLFVQLSVSVLVGVPRHIGPRFPQAMCVCMYIYFVSMCVACEYAHTIVNTCAVEPHAIFDDGQASVVCLEEFFVGGCLGTGRRRACHRFERTPVHEWEWQKDVKCYMHAPDVRFLSMFSMPSVPRVVDTWTFFKCALVWGGQLTLQSPPTMLASGHQFPN